MFTLLDELVLSSHRPWYVSLIVIPFIIYKMYPPTVKETPDAKDWAENELADMGSITKLKIHDWCIYYRITTLGSR